jgi:hypothetical protein
MSGIKNSKKAKSKKVEVSFGDHSQCTIVHTELYICENKKKPSKLVSPTVWLKFHFKVQIIETRAIAGEALIFCVISVNQSMAIPEEG